MRFIFLLFIVSSILGISVQGADCTNNDKSVILANVSSVHSCKKESARTAAEYRECLDGKNFVISESCFVCLFTPLEEAHKCADTCATDNCISSCNIKLQLALRKCEPLPFERLNDSIGKNAYIFNISLVAYIFLANFA